MQHIVSEIQIVPIKPKDGLVAFASLIYDNTFYFSSIGIYTRPQGGYRLTYPTRKAVTASMTIFHPINRHVATAIEAAVVRKYEEVISGSLLHSVE